MNRESEQDIFTLLILSVTKATDTFDVPPCKFEIGNEFCKHKLILS